MKKAVLVSVHSRKGGVGKTSIVLSTAIQLAAQRKKVAVLDLDTLGAHLSQSLPLKDDLVEGKDGLRFNAGESRKWGKYSEKVYLVQRFSLPEAWGNSKQSLEMIGQHLAIDESIQKIASECGVGEELSMAAERLCLFPMSPYIRDIDRLNSLTLTKQGQITYRRALAALLKEMDDEAYDYIIIDNSPGLSFNAGLSLHTSLAEPAQDQREVYNWFVGNAPWWEHGLIVYELNTYRRLLQRHNTNAVLIVNRVGDKWLEEDKLEVGSYKQIDKGTDLFRKVVERLFCTPLWMSADLDVDRLSNQFLLPIRFGVGILGDDDLIRKAQMTDADYRSAHSEPNGLSNVLRTTGDRSRDFVINGERYLQYFVLPALIAANGGAGNKGQSSKKGGMTVEGDAGPCPGIPPLSPFHHHVNKALVKEITKPGN